MNNDRVMDGSPLLAMLPRLRRYASALVGDPGAADDLVHDTLERFGQKRERGRQARDLREALLVLMHRIHADSAAYERSAAPVARGAHIDRALQSLPLEQRKAILLAVLEDMPYEQVAKILGLPVDTVIGLLSQARAGLHIVMDGPGALAAIR